MAQSKKKKTLQSSAWIGGEALSLDREKSAAKRTKQSSLRRLDLRLELFQDHPNSCWGGDRDKSEL
jgi:hypothetical protein